jgi:phosphoribosyl-ATP pyrophosphohydrolase
MAAFTDPLDALEAVIRSRRGADPATSYTASLFAKGRPKIAQKLGEEAVEAAIASVRGDRAGLVGEAADVIFHLLVTMVDGGVTLDEVRAELAGREGVSGLIEKASRPRQPPLDLVDPAPAPVADDPRRDPDLPRMRPLDADIPPSAPAPAPSLRLNDDDRGKPLPRPLPPAERDF